VGKHLDKFKLDPPANDLKCLFKALQLDLNLNIVRAMCGIALITPSNQSFQTQLSKFDGDTLLQNPDSILVGLHELVVANLKYEHTVWLEMKQLKELQEIHSDPLLPDQYGDLGNLPYLKCAWKKCGKEFDNRDKLLDHVKRCLTLPFLHRFHLYCRSVLEPTPNMDFDSFSKQVHDKFGPEKSKFLDQASLRCYYQQFQPIFQNLIK